MSKYISTKLPLLVLCFLCVVRTSAQDPLESINVPDLDEDSRFGQSVSLSESLAFISAPYQVVNDQPQQGAVYIFDRDSDWDHMATIYAPDGRQFDRFGYSLSAHDDMLAIGAPGNGSGVVYIYKYDNGSLIHVETVEPFLPSGYIPNSMQFGFKVRLTATHLFISAPYYHASPFQRESSVFIYARDVDSWEFEQRIAHPHGQQGTLFGNAFAAQDQRLIVGAPKSDGAATSSGSAFLYEHDGSNWTLQHQFEYAQSITHERFGTSVGIHGDRVIIGSMMHVFDPAEGPKGAAHIYEYSGSSWLHTGMLIDEESARNDYFAQHVDIEGKIAVVSASRSNHTDKVNVGGVHVYRLENGFWARKYKLVPNDSETQHHMYFGGALSLNGKHILIGAHLADNSRNDSGNSFVHDLGSLVNTAEPSETTYGLYPPIPNPFHSETHIVFDLPASSPVSFVAYDIYGRVAEVIHQGIFPAGSMQSISWHPERLSSGSYFVQMVAGKYIATTKAIIIH